ncbi:hypothetical protein [Sphingomonas sp. Leaf205]|uniref:hypothetical protein n=1 Tax=Sphingomonas sp. Leaf205 TaxID=2876551 RepID=UPI001E44D5D0|nr:hypothetical protein [Sphingomonas sp. Leaf205]
MRTDTTTREIERPCSFDRFLSSLGYLPAVASRPIPRTLRDHVGARQFGDFGIVLLAEKPATTDLSDRVQRWRVIDAAAREDMPLREHPDQTADDRRFQFLTAGTAVVIIGWIVFGVLIAAFAGNLR